MGLFLHYGFLMKMKVELMMVESLIGTGVLFVTMERQLTRLTW